MSAARKQSPKSQKLTVSVAALLDAASRDVITLTSAERKAFTKMGKTTPVVLDGPMADAMAADATYDKTVDAVVEALETLPQIELIPEKKTGRHNAKGGKKHSRKVEVTPAPAPKEKKAKASGNSRSPEARKTRRIIREYLRVSLVATDENEDAEIREIAAARAAHLEQLIGAAL